MNATQNDPFAEWGILNSSTVLSLTKKISYGFIQPDTGCSFGGLAGLISNRLTASPSMGAHRFRIGDFSCPYRYSLFEGIDNSG